MSNLLRFAVAAATLVATAPWSASLHASDQANGAALLQRFLARAESPPVEYRALRRLEAENGHFRVKAWLEAWTQYDSAKGFTFEVLGEGGSDYVRRRVLHAALEGEQKMWTAREPERAAFTHANYEFLDGGLAAEGLAWLGVRPRRSDVLLIEGSLFVEPVDGELTRIEGRLSKTPSRWTRRVEVIRRYERIGDTRVPVSTESVAHVLIAGRSTFRMTYEYETINGLMVGSPQPRPTSPPPR